MEKRFLEGKKVKVTVQAGTSVFYYRGIVISASKDYILLDDIKKGYIHVLLSKIISIEEEDKNG